LLLLIAFENLYGAKVTKNFFTRQLTHDGFLGYLYPK